MHVLSHPSSCTCTFKIFQFIIPGPKCSLSFLPEISSKRYAVPLNIRNTIWNREISDFPHKKKGKSHLGIITDPTENFSPCKTCENSSLKPESTLEKSARGYPLKSTFYPNRWMIQTWTCPINCGCGVRNFWVSHPTYWGSPGNNRKSSYHPTHSSSSVPCTV